MSSLNKFVEVWDKTGKIEDVLSLNLILPTPSEVQAHLSSLPVSDQTKIKESLESAMAALSSYTMKMEEDAASLKAQIEQSIQASTACIAYATTPQSSKKKR